MKREFAVEFGRVGVTIEGRERVVDLTFGVGRGECVVFVGPNSAPTHVLLELCGGVISPSQGVVRTLGVDWMTATQAEQDRLRQHVGFVFQKPALINDMTIFNNIALLLRYHTSFDDDVVNERVTARLLEFGINHHRDRYPGELSLGELKLASFARACVLDPWLLLIDDPMMGLDESEMAQLMLVLERYRAEGRITLLIAMHTASRLLHVADRVALVWDSGIIEMGTLAEVCDNVNEAIMKAYVTWETR